MSDFSSLEIPNSSDCISRQDALKPFCIAPDGTRIPEVDCDNFPVEFSVKFIKKYLRSLPSVQPEQHLTCKNCIHLGHGYKMPCKNCKRNPMMPDWYEEVCNNG